MSQTTQRQWIKDLRERSPRVHCMTNYVTVGDVVNMTPAVGGPPVMAQGLHEMEDVTSICSNLILNLGTLEEKAVLAMEVAGRKAVVLDPSIILDPVGATTSRFRRQIAIDMIRRAAPSVIRGNEAEIRALNQELKGHKAGNTCGVDSGAFGAIESCLETVCSLRDLTGAVAIMTGEEDVVAGKERRLIVKNGHPWMARITVSGYMLDGLTGTLCDLYGELGPDGPLEEAVTTVLSAHRLRGELAARGTVRRGGGTGTFCMCLMDEMSPLDDETPERGKKAEIR